MHVMTSLPDSPGPSAGRVRRLWPGALMLGCSLALVVVAGCFLIGVLGLVRPELFLVGGPGTVTRPLTLWPEELALMYTLYGFAFASLVGAVTLFVLGVGCLRRAG